MTVSQNVIYVMQKRGKNIYKQIYKRRSQSAGLERVERRSLEGAYALSTMATAVTAEIQGTDDRRYVTDKHV